MSWQQHVFPAKARKQNNFSHTPYVWVIPIMAFFIPSDRPQIFATEDTGMPQKNIS